MSLINFFRNIIFGQPQPTPVVKVEAIQPEKPDNTNFKFLLNDPSTPELSVDMPLPPLGNDGMEFKVNGLNINEHHKFGSDAWRASQVYTSVANGIYVTQKSLEKKMKKWAMNRPLIIYPHAGNDLNAYYDRKGLKFFSSKHPKTGEVVSTADSVDVVAHELGHATLDALRPDLWNLMAIEVWSFHEAWADLMAIFTVMHNEKMIEAVIAETNGDMFKSNMISKLAEQMGNAIYHHVGGGKGMSPERLRDAVNDFKYTVPENLPARTTDDKLANECHSFGRVFLGAYWEVVVKIYDRKNKQINDPVRALKYAAQYGAELLTRAGQKAPASARMFDSVARTMLIVEQHMENKYQDILNEVFISRKIFNKNTIKVLNNKSLKEFNISNEDIIEFDKAGNSLVYQHRIKSMKIADNMGIRALSNAGNPLFMVEIDIPQDTFAMFDPKGRVIQSLATTQAVAIKSAKSCLDLIHQNNLVKYDGFPEDNDFSSQFSVHNNKLFRNYFE